MHFCFHWLLWVLLICPAHARVFMTIKGKRKSTPHSQTIKGFQQIYNNQNVLLLLQQNKRCFETKICNIFEPLWFVQNSNKSRKKLLFFAISVFWCVTWILLKLLIFWTCGLTFVLVTCARGAMFGSADITLCYIFKMSVFRERERER